MGYNIELQNLWKSSLYESVSGHCLTFKYSRRHVVIKSLKIIQVNWAFFFFFVIYLVSKESYLYCEDEI